MNRSSIPWLSALSFVCAAGFMMACGPRMKPVEYEEPSKGLSSDSEVESASSSSDDAASSASTSSTAGDDSSAASQPASGGSCKGKKCGETCSECPPGDENCMEVLLLKQCDLKGACVPAKVECSAPSDKDAKSKGAKAKDAKSK